MIIEELFKTRSDGVKLYRTYSDEGKPILQIETGIVYSEAIDVENAPYTYEETEEILEEPTYRDIPETITEDLVFAKGERGWWKGVLYESLFDNMTWNPEQFAAAWKEVVEAEYREIPETIAPEEAFSFEERGWWKGELYESLFDNMTWNPEQFAAAWKKVPTDE